MGPLIYPSLVAIVGLIAQAPPSAAGALARCLMDAAHGGRPTRDFPVIAALSDLFREQSGLAQTLTSLLLGALLGYLATRRHHSESIASKRSILLEELQRELKNLQQDYDPPPPDPGQIYLWTTIQLNAITRLLDGETLTTADARLMEQLIKLQDIVAVFNDVVRTTMPITILLQAQNSLPHQLAQQIDQHVRSQLNLVREQCTEILNDLERLQHPRARWRFWQKRRIIEL